MKTLIIAEKPSQAKEYSMALKCQDRKDGYFENEKYFITWCFGHLIGLENDEKYRGEGSWSKSYLPLIPEKFEYTIGKNKGIIDEGKEKQIGVIQNLISQSFEIINATDSDREGELIFLYVYNYLKCNLPYKRLWISSLTEGDILKGFDNLLSKEDVANLGKSGYARAIADWLVGINGTQACSLQFGGGTLLTIGRVQTVILKIICERFLKNKNFQKTFSYKIRANHISDGQVFFSESDVFEKKETVEKLSAALSDNHICIERDSRIQKVSPPLLHSIDSLIVEANRLFGYDGQKTLNSAQSLYEKKLTSYPRTDSNYINEENYANLKNHVPNLAKDFLKFDYSIGDSKPKSVNAKKLTGSHDAIVPTGEKSAYFNLSEQDKNVYDLILHKCLESFSENAEYDKLKLTFLNTDIEFYTYSSKLIKVGWKKYSFQKNQNNTEYEIEQCFDLKIKENNSLKLQEKEIKEIESNPPQLYTDATLTPDLTNIGKFLKEENPELLAELKTEIDLNDVQIGTQATRPAIIERLKFLGLIQVEKNKYLPTEKGLEYFNVIKNLSVTNIATTAVWEQKLKRVAEGKMEDSVFYAEIKEYIKTIVGDVFSIESSHNFSQRKEFGTCPKCKIAKIVEGQKGYGCSGYKLGCNFVIWKEIAKKKIPDTDVKLLIEKGATGIIKGFQGKEKSFDAKLKLDVDFKVVFDFEKITLGACPKCKKGTIQDSAKSYNCDRYKDPDKCDFTIWKTIGDKNITISMADHLLKKGQTGIIKGFKDKAGKSFDAKLKLTNEFKMVYLK